MQIGKNRVTEVAGLRLLLPGMFVVAMYVGLCLILSAPETFADLPSYRFPLELIPDTRIWGSVFCSIAVVIAVCVSFGRPVMLQVALCYAGVVYTLWGIGFLVSLEPRLVLTEWPPSLLFGEGSPIAWLWPVAWGFTHFAATKTLINTGETRANA